MLCTIALAVSLLFPNVQARPIGGPPLETNQQRGTPIVYLIGFTPDSRTETAAWKKSIATATGGALRAIEMPVLSGMAVMVRPIIESSMARKTPEAERPNLQTTTDRSLLIEGLQLADPDRAAVVTLVDARGEVRLMLRGAPTPEQEAALTSAWQQLRSAR